MTIQKVSREELRQYFADGGLSSNRFSENNLNLLRAYVDEEIYEFNIEMSGKKPKYWEHTLPLVGGRIINAKGAYFDSREVFAFSEKGYISIALDADDTNLIPIGKAFIKWCDRIKNG